MKTAIYIEDGTIQLVITPETEFEKSSIKIMTGKKVEAKIFDGTFYDCRGGWIRQSQHYPQNQYKLNSGDNSLIIRVDEKEEEVK